MPAGVILCGGSSARLGTPKALVDVAGLRAVDRVAQSMKLAGLKPVVAVTGGDGPLAAQLAGPHLDAVLEDTAHRPVGGQGPLCGVVAALDFLQQDAVVCPVDMPWVSPPLLRWLGEQRHATHVPGNPLCALLAVAALPEGKLLLGQGSTGMKRLWNRIPHRVAGLAVLAMVDPGGSWRISFNTHEELHRARLAGTAVLDGGSV